MSNAIPLPPLPEPVYTYDEDGNKVYYEKAKKMDDEQGGGNG